MREMLSRYEVRQFLTYSNFKASQVEKAQHYFQSLLYRHMVSKQTLNYMSVLYEILSTYNHSYSRVIKMTPIEALKPENGEILSRNLSVKMGRMKVTKRKPMYKAGDTVRVLFEQTKYSRGYGVNFSYRRYKIHSVNQSRSIPTYVLATERGRVLSGPFYDYELQLVNIPTYLGRATGEVRKIRGVKHYKFHYLGYGSSDDEWLPEDNLQGVGQSESRNTS